jgi:type II secretory pathway pseudopilin PulG
MTHRTGQRQRSGFTLVEAIAVMCVLAIVGSLSSALIHTGVASYRDAAAQSLLHEEAATALARLAVELRRIPLDSGAGTTAPLISSVTATSMAWNGNYSLALSGSELRLVEAGGPAATLLDNVVSLTIQCFDESNTAMAAGLSGAACHPIRRVSVWVTVARDGRTDSLRCKFFIRSAMKGGSA